MMVIAALQRAEFRRLPDLGKIAAAHKGKRWQKEKAVFHGIPPTRIRPSAPIRPETVVFEVRFITRIISPAPPRARALPSARITRPPVRYSSATIELRSIRAGGPISPSRTGLPA